MVQNTLYKIVACNLSINALENFCFGTISPNGYLLCTIPVNIWAVSVKITRRVRWHIWEDCVLIHAIIRNIIFLEPILLYNYQIIFLFFKDVSQKPWNMPTAWFNSIWMWFEAALVPSKKNMINNFQRSPGPELWPTKWP